MSAIETDTQDCSAHGCTAEARWRLGPYAGLCEEHAKQKKDERAGRRAPNITPLRKRTVFSEGLAAKVKELSTMGREADRARARAVRLTEQALAAKALADIAEERFHARARELMGDNA